MEEEKWICILLPAYVLPINPWECITIEPKTKWDSLSERLGSDGMTWKDADGYYSGSARDISPQNMTDRLPCASWIMMKCHGKREMKAVKARARTIRKILGITSSFEFGATYIDWSD